MSRFTDTARAIRDQALIAKDVIGLTGGESGVDEVVITVGGVTYTIASLSFSSGAAAGTVTLQSGSAFSTTITTKGSYAFGVTPTVTIGGDGTGATAVAKMTPLKLDAILTATRTIGQCVTIALSGSWYVYQLTAGTTAEASPTVIRPDDYNGTTNQKVWVLVTIMANGTTFSGPLTGSNLTMNKVVGVQSALTFASTTNVDLDGLDERTLVLTGDITFTHSNAGAGKATAIFITCDAASHTFTFPGAWVFVGPKPTMIAANKRAVLSLKCVGTTVWASYCVEA